MTRRIRVGILGATGTVGQRFIQLLDGHPQFEVTALAASDRSAGKAYAEACAWRLPGEMPPAVRQIRVEAPLPPLDCELVFSSLPGEIARETEEAFAAAGCVVISNSSALRMDADVPLLVPEVNADHLKLVAGQRQRRNWSRGFVITNPNCSAAGIVIPLAVLQARFGIEQVVVTTMQAISGAGYPGVASLDITDNILSFIPGEEEKVETEALKILGRRREDSVEPAPFSISAQCNRVNVVDGHTASVRVMLNGKPEVEEIRDAFAAFTSLPQELKLHSAPERPIIVRDERDRPQPRLDRMAGNGMSVTLGRIERDRVFDVKFVALSHNTIRGAAGAAVLNAELAVAAGLL